MKKSIDLRGFLGATNKRQPPDHHLYRKKAENGIIFFIRLSIY
jgi:hypothetical protein